MKLNERRHQCVMGEVTVKRRKAWHQPLVCRVLENPGMPAEGWRW